MTLNRLFIVYKVISELQRLHVFPYIPPCNLGCHNQTDKNQEDPFFCICSGSLESGLFSAWSVFSERSPVLSCLHWPLMIYSPSSLSSRPLLDISTYLCPMKLRFNRSKSVFLSSPQTKNFFYIIPNCTLLVILQFPITPKLIWSQNDMWSQLLCL